MNLLTEFEVLLTRLNRQQLEFALCGGLAVNVLGHVRATRDIDILIPRNSLDPVRDAAKELGFTLRSGRIPFGQGTPKEREVWRVTKPEGTELVSLDLLLVTPVFEKVWSERKTIDWKGHTLPIVSLEGLAFMKRLAGRAQDLADLEALGVGDSKE